MRHSISIGRRPDANDFETEHLIYLGGRWSWNTRSQASEPAVDPNIQNQARRSAEQQAVFYSGASSAAVICGSPNSSLTYDNKPVLTP